MSFASSSTSTAAASSGQFEVLVASPRYHSLAANIGAVADVEESGASNTATTSADVEPASAPATCAGSTDAATASAAAAVAPATTDPACAPPTQKKQKLQQQMNPVAAGANMRIATGSSSATASASAIRSASPPATATWSTTANRDLTTLDAGTHPRSIAAAAIHGGSLFELYATYLQTSNTLCDLPIHPLADASGLRDR